MPNKLTVVLSGRKQSGKTSTCNYILAKYLNTQLPREFHHYINDVGDLKCVHKKFVEDIRDVKDQNLHHCRCKRYNFADLLKKFCVEVLNVPYEACWGTDVQKNTLVPHILWENFPREVRPKTIKRHDSKFQEFSGVVREAWDEEVLATGPMTGREILQYFGTEIVRKIYGDCWAHGTYTNIKNEGFELVVVTDGRFPNEIDLGKQVNAKSVRLLRAIYTDEHKSEKALDNYPLENYSVVVDNRHMTLEQQCRYMDPIIDQWFAEAGIV